MQIVKYVLIEMFSSGKDSVMGFDKKKENWIKTSPVKFKALINLEDVYHFNLWSQTIVH